MSTRPSRPSGRPCRQAVATQAADMAIQSELRPRISPSSNIEQITRAMEMVASTKLRRFQDRAVASRPVRRGDRPALVRPRRRLVDEETDPAVPPGRGRPASRCCRHHVRPRAVRRLQLQRLLRASSARSRPRGRRSQVALRLRPQGLRTSLRRGRTSIAQRRPAAREDRFQLRRRRPRSPGASPALPGGQLQRGRSCVFPPSVSTLVQRRRGRPVRCRCSRPATTGGAAPATSASSSPTRDASSTAPAALPRDARLQRDARVAHLRVRQPPVAMKNATDAADDMHEA